MFGGAFNPPTIAHIELADHARTAVGADYVIFVPTKNAYIADEQHKSYVFSDTQRLAMLERIASRHPWMKVSHYEIDSEAQPRTYQTLCHLKEEGYQCRLLMGSDKLPELEHGWKFVEQITQEFGIVCMERSEDDVAEILKNDAYLSTLIPYIQVLPTPAKTRHVSSTAVRKLLSEIQASYVQLKTMVPTEISETLIQCVLEDETCETE